METPENHTNPFQISKQDEIHRVNRSIETINILLFLLVAVMVSVIYISKTGAFDLRRLFHLHEATFRIVFPAASVFILSILTRAYPLSIRHLKAMRGDVSLSPRLNTIGTISLVLALNYLYAVYFAWDISILIVLVCAYLLSAILPVRSVFGSDIKPPSLWSFREISYKIILLFFVIHAGGEMWVIIMPPHDVFEYLGIDNFITSVFTLTILIPFYISYFVSSLPRASEKLTYGITDDDLIAKFES